MMQICSAGRLEDSSFAETAQYIVSFSPKPFTNNSKQSLALNSQTLITPYNLNHQVVDPTTCKIQPSRYRSFGESGESGEVGDASVSAVFSARLWKLACAREPY